jgi:hypothetical protein
MAEEIEAVEGQDVPRGWEPQTGLPGHSGVAVGRRIPEDVQLLMQAFKEVCEDRDRLRAENEVLREKAWMYDELCK